MTLHTLHAMVEKLLQASGKIGHRSARDDLALTRSQRSLENNKSIRAFAGCHDWHWDLSDSERKELAAMVPA